MAIGDAYASVEEYRRVVKHSDDEDDAAIQSHLLAVSRYFERELGQFFTRDATVVSRTYVGDGSRCLRVDNISTTTGLVIAIDEDDDGSFADETALVSTDYELRPLNADQGPEVKPWTEVYLPSWSNYGAWPRGHRVQVTARFGWPAVPRAIWSAVIEMTAIWRGESPRSTGRMSELDETVAMSPLAMSLVRRLREVYWMPVLA